MFITTLKRKLSIKKTLRNIKLYILSGHQLSFNFFFNDMKFSDKRIEIETTVILSEVTQTLGDKYGMYSIISGY